MGAVRQAQSRKSCRAVRSRHCSAKESLTVPQSVSVSQANAGAVGSMGASVV